MVECGSSHIRYINVVINVLSDSQYTLLYYSDFHKKGLGSGGWGLNCRWPANGRCAMVLITTALVGNKSSTFKSAELGGIRSARET